MNIKEAKESILRAIQAYFAKDEDGFPLVPILRQRPILLLGPPGIGKTAIMEQIARECGVGLVSYTMTHHTRQSAMGLPEIRTQEIDGKTVHTTEYTMSEIIAAMYRCQEKTGKSGGILFLDEINCVSETLAPVMLQLLQEKKFGNQQIPKDWLIVAAGNPPEYNKSVREFDVATLDRVRKIEVEPDLSVWLSYAAASRIHGAIRSYLAAHAERFYAITQEQGEKEFVTARGWEDLSAILKSYERMKFPVEESLVLQYLQEEKTAEEFFDYYQIYTRYGEDYGVAEILSGTISGEERKRKQKMAAKGQAEERMILLSLFLAALEKDAVISDQLEKIAKGLYENFWQLQSLLKYKKDVTFSLWLEEKERSLQIRTEKKLMTEKEREMAVRIQKKLKRIGQAAKEYHKTEEKEQMELFETVCALEMERSRKEKQNMCEKVQRARQFLKESFSDGAELTLFEAKMARSERLRPFLLEEGGECDEL